MHYSVNSAHCHYVSRRLRLFYTNALTFMQYYNDGVVVYVINMSKIDLIKNTAIILDFVISIVASVITTSMPEISNILFSISAVVLIIAVICVLIEIVSWWKISKK